MKKASSVMYTIGNVFNIIEVVVYAILIVVMVVGMGHLGEILQKLQEQGITDITTEEQLKALMLLLVGLSIFAIVVKAIILVVVCYAKKALRTDQRSFGIHIAVLVLSILCGGLFYLLGSIFGLVATNQIKQPE